ncbi:hypothetical protein [Cupriavidus basilensis]|uniref:hypothetical protein n=1 Tax=Cupriavidus basilensis TaxID=68895 RepID=UPI0039F65728
MSADRGERFLRMADGAVATASLLIAMALFLGAIGVPLYQAYVWMKAGTWPPLSALDGIKWLAGPEAWNSWLYWPEDWIGVHKILQECPISLALILAAVAPVWVFSKVSAN